jgi:polyvinyl alcohol dehydrogenase (cytochrome)
MKSGAWICIAAITSQMMGCTAPVEPESARVESHEAALDNDGHADEHAQDSAPGGWRMTAFDPSGSGNNTHEHTLGRGNVQDLQVQWTFDAQAAGEPVAPIHATPVVADGNTYVGSYGGRFYAIDEHGQLRWTFDTYAPGPLFSLFFGGRAPIVAGAVLPEREASVVFGDTDGRIYKLDRATGELRWTIDLDAHDLGGIWGNSLMVLGDTLFVGIASFEPLAPLFPTRTCCTHRGAVVAVDLTTGTVKWRYEAIDPSTQGPLPQALIDQLGGFESYGPSGGDVWSQPTYDRPSNTLYFGTGQLFSRAADGSGPPTHDAIIALDASTGQMKWVRHLSNNVDVFRFDIPYHDVASGNYYDKDVADQPKIYRLANGRKVVGAGQKNGVFHVLDAQTGAVVSSTQYIDMITGEGGFQSGGAVNEDAVFAHGMTSSTTAGAPYDGILMALEHDGKHEKWELTLPASPLMGGLAIANGVLYFQSPFEEGLASADNPQTWALYAVDTDSGKVLKRVTFPNARSLNGPVVSDGRVYAAFGDAFSFGLASPSQAGGVVCLGLPRHR